DHADEETRDGDDEADVADERPDQIELRAVRLHDADVERAHAERLALAVCRPEVAEVRDADQRLEAACGRTPRSARVEDSREEAADDPEADRVDEDREEARAKTGFLSGRRGRHGR